MRRGKRRGATNLVTIDNGDSGRMLVGITVHKTGERASTLLTCPTWRRSQTESCPGGDGLVGRTRERFEIRKEIERARDELKCDGPSKVDAVNDQARVKSAQGGNQKEGRRRRLGIAVTEEGLLCELFF